MEALRKQLDEAIEKYGLSDPKVFGVSKELENKICKEQRRRLESEVKCY